MSNLYRLLPSTDACLKHFAQVSPASPEIQLPHNSPPTYSTLSVSQENTISPYPHTLLCNTITLYLNNLRAQIKNSTLTEADLQHDIIMQNLCIFVERKLRPSLQRVINATGVVIHTNLGRSTLAKDAIEAVHTAASDYSNLEFDLETGERGSRHSLVEADICALTGAESALVVNNNAAAVLLMLNTICQGGESIVSRGQLVEIGGSFRIPDVMEKSGSTLKEVGTTNRCHPADYENAINEHTKAILRVHTSNYRIIGFHKDVPTHELAQITKKYNLPLLEDLGSGSFVDFTPYGLADEPTVKSVLQAGVDVVTFSGDKVLGGPQAGIIAGKKIYIDAIKKNQLLRALRCDKLTLAALAATMRLYYDPEKALHEIPTLRRMTISKEELVKKANTLCAILQAQCTNNHIKNSAYIQNHITFSKQSHVSRVGGGSFPEKDLPTSVVCLSFNNVNLTATKDTNTLSKETHKLSAFTLRKALLANNPPLVGRIENDCFMLDVRTLEEKDFPLIAEILLKILSDLTCH